MESITLGQICAAIALIGGLITGGTVIVKQIKKGNVTIRIFSLQPL